MAFTMKLQSPAYNAAGLGQQIALPVAFDTHQGSSLADILTAPGGKNLIFDFAQLREVINLAGVLTDAAAVEAGYSNAVHMRDAVRQTRSVWPNEDGTTAGGHWGTATLPADERDASTPRKASLTRLVFDKAWDTGTGQFVNLYMYGSIGDFRFGPRAAASGRYRIPFGINFLVGRVVVG